VEGTAQQVDSGIVGGMLCVAVKIMWKLLHSRWTVVLWVECCMLQCTLCGRHCTAGGQWYCGWMLCVTVNIMWTLLHSKWTVVLCVECSVLQWTVCGRNCTAGGQWYFGLNGVCYSQHYVGGTAQQVDCSIVGCMKCVTVNSIRKMMHSKWTVGLQVEWCVLQWTLCGRYCTAGGQWYCGLNVVCYS